MKKIVSLTLFILLLTACSGRDLSNVKTSLYGHWENKESNTHYYFSDGKLTVVDEGEQLEKTYKVLEHDEIQNTIHIREKDKSGGGFIKEITYNNDAREAVEVLTDPSTIEFGREEGTSKDKELTDFVEQTIKENMPTEIIEESWVYIDDKQVP